MKKSAQITIKVATERFLQGYYTGTREYEHFAFEPSKFPGINAGEGDRIKVIYTESEKIGIPREIIGIAEWRLSKMRERIITIIRECLQFRQQATQKYATICKNYGLSAEGKEKERQKAVDSIADIIAGKMREGEKLFTAKIEEFDEAEEREIQRKNSSLEYQQMLQEKAAILKQLDTNKLEGQYLKAYLQEFENDPIAIELLRSCITPDIGFKGDAYPIPLNNLGERQKMLEKLSDEFKTVLREIARIDGTNDIATSAIAESYMQYMQAQDEDFSTTREEVWEKMSNSSNARSAGFGFKFNRVR